MRFFDGLILNTLFSGFHSTEFSVKIFHSKVKSKKKLEMVKIFRIEFLIQVI